MFLNRSTGRKFLVTIVAAVFFAALYEVTMMDSRFAARQADNELTAAPAQGARLRFTATGYCRGTTTASGVNVRSGIAAADPDLLPVGSVVQIDKLPDRYNGVYTVMDTGPKVHGRHLDIYIWNCDEALRLGTPEHGDYGAPYGVESPEQHSAAGGPPLPAARGRVAAPARMADSSALASAVASTLPSGRRQGVGPTRDSGPGPGTRDAGLRD
jgi:3D (Asp-Asp-Asp) domain-containing protein